MLNILVIDKTFPWPEVSGTHIRVANVVRALARVGEVDFLVMKKGGPVPSTPPPGEPVARFAAAARPLGNYRGVRRLGWALSGSLPVEMATRDYSDVRSLFLDWARPRYDLLWMGRAESYVALGGLVEAPTIVDFDDLKDRRITGSLRISSSRDGPEPDGDRRLGLRRLVSRLRDTTNARRWRALQRSIAASVEAVTVCSRIDQRRLGAANAVVIPNGYEPPARPVGQIEVGHHPTLVFPGLFRYGPNIDGARFLVREVLPRIRSRGADVRLRLVGDYDHRIEDLHHAEGVTLTGRVPEMAPELARADAIVVPIRFGSGTRIKVLEAFAHRIPVVSTTLGCEGLDALDRRHLLVADDPDAFAAACIEILEDGTLRRRVAEAAHEFYWERYRWDLIAPMIAALAVRVTGRRSERLTQRSK